MKKITFLIVLAALLSGWYGTAQITTYPYSEDFEAGAGGWVATNGANGTWALGAPTANVINSAASGANAWATNLSGNYNATDNSSVQSPVFDFSSLAAPSIEFSIWWNSEFSWDGAVLQSSINSGTSWQNVGAFGDANNWYNDNTINGAPGGQPAATAQGWTGRISSNNGSAGWVVARHTLTGLAGQSNVIFRFAFGSDGSIQDNGVAFDSISIFDVVCPEPSGIMVAGQTATTANISWTPGLTETAWEVVVQPAGSGVPSGSGIATTLNSPYPAAGLDPITTYEVYVRANCGANGFSSWAGPVSFTTLCSVFTPDYFATFDTFIQDCWEEADSGNPTTGPMTIGTGSWGADGFANVGFAGANSINLWLAAKSDWMISPLFDLTGGPFQVELDLAIQQFGESTIAGTLGSDDQVQLLITNDNGATWIPLNIWNNTSAVPSGGQHYLYNLAAYNGQTVQFAMWATEGTVDDTADNEVSFDNFQVRAVPTCPEPTVLVSNNLSLTSTEVSWTENGSATLWNIEYGPSGFTPGTGTLVTGVTTNPYVINGLDADTLYQFYVQADCGSVDGLSTWTGPGSFFTGYCTSVPTSNDGQGVTNVTIGVTDFPSFGDVTYENHTATPVNAFQGIETNVSIAFATGFTYDANIWIDFNDNLVFEASEIVFQGTSAAPNPSTLNATFTMPVTAPIGQHRMRIGTADTGQATPNPCYNGTFGVTLDFTINVLVLDCVLPAAEYTAVPDCAGNQFFIEVNVTSLGDATSLEISNSSNTDTTQAMATGIYPIGPFAFGTTVRAFVTSEQNSNCVITSPNFNILACPPANDNCANATIAAVNPGGTCDNTTPGTVLAATPSGVPAGTCAGNPDDDVWFQFTALNEVQSISLINITGGSTNLDHAVYTGSCGALTELYCSPNSSSFTPLLTVGTTYFIRVFSGGSIPETSSFDLCIQKAPENTICEQAANFCSAGGASVGPNITGISNNSPIACLGTAPNPSWNIIQIGDPGLVEIEIVQTSSVTGAGIDVDFVLWGPFDANEDFCSLGLEVDCPTCPNNTTNPNFYPFGNIVDCSYDAASVENLTIDNAQAGELYVLLVTNFANQPGNISITQTNTGGGTTVAEIQVDLGGDQELCGTDSLVLTANSPFADTYEWYADGFIIDGETGPTLTVTESNTYTVIVYDSQCDVTAQDAVTITLGLEPVANAVLDIVTCDDITGDGFEAFNLDAQTAGILGTQDPTLFNVTYHLSQSDAITNTGALTSPYTNISNPQQIWVRIEDANAAFCIGTTSFNLVVSGATPTATSANLEVCDDLSGDGIASFDLTTNNVYILNGQNPADFSVTYYATQADADAEMNPLVSPYTNTTNPQTIWARVDNNAAVDCYATAPFDLIVSPLPTANTSPDIAGCDTDDNDIAEYDLTENQDAITGGGTGLVVTYYTTMADAAAGTGSITTPTDYETLLTTIYVRVDDTVTGCFNVTSFDLVAGELPMTALSTDIEFEVCPNATVPIIVTAIAQNYTAADVSIRWYQDGVLISGESSLTLSVLTAGFYEIEVTFNATGCTDFVGQQIIELPSCIIPQGISPNGDGQNDTFDLSSFNVVRIEIFNRLGRMVYSKDNYTNEWFGQTNGGDELPVGTYFYTMIYEGGAKTKSSWVYINK